jgi:glutamyl-tRNA reductase
MPVAVVDESSDRFTGRQAARHLLRVTAGLESFVLGESDIVGQVRSAADASRAAGTGGLELERLLATAVNTSRRVHRSTSFGEGGRSVAAAAVHQAATDNGGDLAGRRVLVIGAGQVATEVATSAARLGAAVTVCNRTKRHADRFAAAGATVVDLSRLAEVLPTADLAIFGTAAPHRLLDAAQLAGLPGERARDLLIVDLCVPRNVDPAVRAVPGVRLVDLADLRRTAAHASEAVTRDVTRAEQIVDEELDRYLRWLAGRAAAVSVRRLRADVDACAQSQAELATRGLPEHLRPAVEDGVRRAVRRLAHGPTKRLMEAAAAGDEHLVAVLAGLFSDQG